jgi:hypothetical protein
VLVAFCSAPCCARDVDGGTGNHCYDTFPAAGKVLHPSEGPELFRMFEL